MRTVGLVFLLVLTGASARSQERCLSVSGDVIRASDLVVGIPELGALRGDLIFGPAPVLGATRWFQPGEIERWAENHGIPRPKQSLNPACLVRTGLVYSREAIEAAMRTALQSAEWEGRIARFELLRHPQVAFPEGRLEFRIDELKRASVRSTDGVVTWPGKIVLNSGRTLPFSADVRVLLRYSSVVATRDLQSGDTISESDLASSEWMGAPFRDPERMEVRDLCGRTLRRAVAKGTPIDPRQLSQRADVNRGDTVHVVVRTGSALLEMEARSRSIGKKGATVILESPISKKVFQATVTGVREAEVVEKEDAKRRSE